MKAAQHLEEEVREKPIQYVALGALSDNEMGLWSESSLPVDWAEQLFACLAGSPQLSLLPSLCGAHKAKLRDIFPPNFQRSVRYPPDSLSPLALLALLDSLGAPMPTT